MKKILFLSLIIFILLISCNDVSNFLFETEQTVKINSINNGSIIRSGESLPVSIVFDGTIVPESFTVTIIDEMGEERGETVVPIPESEIEYSTSLVIPEELPPGKYTFYVRVYESDTEISFKEIIIFKTDEDYIVEQLVSMPFETEAEKDVIIQADITYPENGDPFLRWSLDGSVLEEGLLSEGFDTFHWQAAEDNGLYHILLEVFPESCNTSMQSSVFDIAEIVVTDNPLTGSDLLTPEEEYSLLFHFSGDHIPENPSEFTISESGEIKPEAFNNKLMYSFSENSGIQVVGSVIPMSNGDVSAFSINGGFSLYDSSGEGNFIKVTSESNELFSLTVNETDNLEFTVGNHSSVSLFSVKEFTVFSLQVIPSAEGIEIRWFRNGDNGGNDFLNTTFIGISEEQTVIIGGDENSVSADMVIDELGFYVKSMEQSSVDDSQFFRNKKQIYGENLIAAEGFDGESGDRVFVPGEKVLLQTFPQSVKETEVILSFRIPVSNEEWELVLEDEKGNELVRVPNSYALEVTEEETGVISREIKLSLLSDTESNEIELKGNNDFLKILNVFNPGKMLSLFIDTDVENENNVLLDFYIIYTNVDSIIPEVVAAVEEESDFL